MPKIDTSSDALSRSRTSRDWFERASRVMVEGASAPSRGPRSFIPNPPYIVGGRGSRLFDIEGNHLVDLSLGYGCNPLGHAHPAIVAAVEDGAREGVHFGAAIPEEVEFSELIVALCPVDVVRLGSSGTETCMAAVRLARAYTGRDKIVKFEGNFHGWFDSAIVTADAHDISEFGEVTGGIAIVEGAGVPKSVTEDTIVVPWNDPEAIAAAMERHGRRVACVMTEPVMANLGVIPPRPGYLETLQELCADYGALFYLDETVTGFRLSAGGYATKIGLSPDIITYGKALGHGFPIGALAGKRDIMECLKLGKLLNGTHNACRLPVKVALAGLRELCSNSFAGFERLESNGTRMADAIRDAIGSQSKHSAIVQGYGPIFQIMFTGRDSISSYREYCKGVDELKFKRFANICRKHGVYMNPTNSLKQNVSTVHDSSDIDTVAEAIARALHELE